MTVNTEFTDKTSAADKSVGFDFQYYYFLYRLLNLKSNEAVGLEVLDDVHSELASDRQILVQLKHTTQTKANGSTKNLTALDIDLWKSFSNWSQTITDKNAGRASKNAQLEFIKKTDFLLVSNKSESERNTVLNEIKRFQNNEIQYAGLQGNLGKLQDKSTNDSVKTYIQNVLDLNAEVGEAFFRNVDFDLNHDAVIQRCKDAIKEKMVPDNKIEETFKSLDSQIRQDNFIAIKNKEKIIIGFDAFHKKYRRHFDIARNEDLLIKPFTGVLPDQLAEQRFIQQLLDIEDIQEHDHESMAKFSYHKLKMQNNIDDWYHEGELTENEVKAFDNEAKTRWENKFREVYRQCPEDKISQKALELLDAMRKEKLPIGSQELPTDMCNGQYYRLSDTPEIGWHKDWEKRFNE